MTTPLQSLLDSHVERGTILGAVALLGTADGMPEQVTVGSVAVDGPPLRSDAIMRIQSMTKAVTSVSALRLVASGRLGLDDGLEPWLPELADRRVLASPAAALSETVPATRPITLRHLLTNTSGYGMIPAESPLQRAMAENGTEAGVDPVALGADEWLARLAELPLAFQPGEGWRYHHSFSILGILLSRITGRLAGDHLRDDLFDPLGMVDTSFWAPPEKAHRLPAAYRHAKTGFLETEPVGGGFSAGEPPFDVSHGELVSTADDYFGFLRMLVHGGIAQTGPARGERIVPAELAAAMVRDQVPASAKASDSFFSPDFWEHTGWGYGVGVETTGPHPGRYTWSGGQGTNFYVDPDGTIGVLLTQREADGGFGELISEFQDLPAQS
ncbi:beta-lactamase family protein [Microbacterium sp. 4R-513]|uniref:serine hydrolase domain-containing protein n=1 Tax=Microbacterium sp. 4R-513 TaxID=2567934 RepID=UPI0013E0F1D0|nr:serine hydrolase domain-containing protein [Microbacterium sp. 4R-513]QIG38426.1 beta-lactamase family protein [Microbacterium sp. 4R-513]